MLLSKPLYLLIINDPRILNAYLQIRVPIYITGLLWVHYSEYVLVCREMQIHHIYIYIATERFLRFHEYKNITTHKKYYTALKPGLPNPLAITATRTIKSCSWYTTRFFFAK